MRPPFLAVVVFLASPALAQGEDDSLVEFWPEADVYWRLNNHARLLFLASANEARDVEARIFETGAFVDIFVPRFRPVLFRRISHLDDSRAKRISLRAGYKYVVRTRAEHRFQTGATLRWVFPAGILASDRNRAEYRLIEGAYSWRYRNEAKLERDFAAWGRPVTPYIAAELFYDSRYRALSRWRYTGGTTVTLGPHWTVELYYTYQVGKHPRLQLVHAVGLTVSFFGP